MIFFFAVHFRRQRLEAVGDDEECGNREVDHQTETFQVRNTTVEL